MISRHLSSPPRVPSGRAPTQAANFDNNRSFTNLTGNTFRRFLESLFGDARLRVEPFAPMSPDEKAAGVELLAQAEPSFALELPGESPGFDATAAVWAAERIMRGCRLAVYRELPAEAVAEALDPSRSFAVPRSALPQRFSILTRIEKSD